MAGLQKRYGPAACTGEEGPILGIPDRAHFITSRFERQNLAMRMIMGRFARLTNAFLEQDRQAKS